MNTFKLIDFDGDCETYLFCTEGCAESFADNHNLPRGDIREADESDFDDIDNGKCDFCNCALKETSRV